MPGPEAQLSIVTFDESSLNESPAASGEFTNLLRDTSPFFDTWLESIKPVLTSDENLVPAVETFPQASRTSGPPPVPGEFRFEGTLRVDCYIAGLVRSETGTLLLTETGEVETDLFVGAAIIHGVVRGDIRATERVELGSSARVIGNIETPSLRIQSGAIFEGHCHFVQRSGVADNRESPESPAENPRLSVVASRRVMTGASETDMEEAVPLVAAAGR